MLRKTVILGATAMVVTLLTSGTAHGWGAFHAGFTHIGPAGAFHYGTTSVGGPYGAYSGAHYGAVGAGGGSVGAPGTPGVTVLSRPLEKSWFRMLARSAASA